MSETILNSEESSGPNVELGFPVFTRTKAVERCLESVPAAAVDRVIIADNGEREHRNEIYSREWPFSLDVIDLPYDSGIGACRSSIVDELTGQYLFMCDNDMIIPTCQELARLQSILDVNPELGGVSGVLIEGNRVRSGGTDLHVEQLISGKRVVVKSVRKQPTVHWLDDRTPYVMFDLIPQAGLFRRECLETAAWDPDLPDHDHVDFFLSHRTSDWDFAVCPSVSIRHMKDVGEGYRDTVRSGESAEQKRKRANEVLDKKWNIQGVTEGDDSEWIESRKRSPVMASFDLYRKIFSTSLWLPIKNIADKLGVDN